MLFNLNLIDYILVHLKMHAPSSKVHFPSKNLYLFASEVLFNRYMISIDRILQIHSILLKTILIEYYFLNRLYCISMRQINGSFLSINTQLIHKHIHKHQQTHPHTHGLAVVVNVSSGDRHTHV